MEITFKRSIETYRYYLTTHSVFTFFKVNNENARIKFEICFRLTIKTPERQKRRLFGVFIANFEQISQAFLLCPLMTSNK